MSEQDIVADVLRIDAMLPSDASQAKQALMRLRNEVLRLRNERNEALEAAAAIAKAHVGSAAKRRGRRKLSTYDEDTAMEIQAEERGEDIAAAMIETAIRALAHTSLQAGPSQIDSLETLLNSESDEQVRILPDGSVVPWERRKAAAMPAVDVPTNYGGSMSTSEATGPRLVGPHGGLKGPMPCPTKADLQDPLFDAIWQATKTWDVSAPEYYIGYCGLNGSHVMLILSAIRNVPPTAAGMPPYPPIYKHEWRGINNAWTTEHVSKYDYDLLHAYATRLAQSAEAGEAERDALLFTINACVGSILSRYAADKIIERARAIAAPPGAEPKGEA